MASFAGTTQKCMACEKTVYLVDKLTADNRVFHKRHSQGTPKLMKPEKPSENENAKSVSNMFGGTRDKCSGCTKTVYPIEKVTVNGTAYHKSCFKCSHGGCTISPSNYIAHEGKLYCKHHHIQLFKEKGNYSQLETERQKNNSAVAAAIKLTTPMEIAAES
uniref:LIM zinc-binding domain-containing protein n=1 Tax=Cucumis melo TaxID=3656 RepID=A0A9I9DHV3_CUCME